MRKGIRVPASIAAVVLLGFRSVSLASDTSSLFPDCPDPDSPCTGVAFNNDVAPASGGWLRGLWREHRYHLLTVFLLGNADRIYEQQVGPPDNPRLFGSPPGFDQAVSRRFDGRSGGDSFIASHKSAITQLVSLSAIAWVNGGRWEQSVDDLIGLIEAHKINWSTSSLVKNIVGRRRPSLQQDYEAGNIEALGLASPSKRNSFYSDAASKAFTYMAYTDSILARRFRGHRQARIWSAVGLYGLAGTIAYSRVEAGQHYLSDVIAGAGAGFLVGKIVYRANHRKRDRAEAAWSVRPMLVPGGAGISVSIRPGRQVRDFASDTEVR